MVERARLVLACVLIGVAALAWAARPEDAVEPLPAGAVLRIGTVCFHHAGATRVEFSPDGKRLLSVGFDGMRLWDLATGQPLREIRLGWLNFAGFSHDGRTIVGWNDNPKGQGVVTSGQNPVVHVLDAETGKTLRQFPLAGSSRGLRYHPTVMLGPGLSSLATKIADEPLIVYDVAAGNVIHRLDSEPAKSLRPFPDGLAFSPDGKFVAGSSYRDVYFVFDTATGKQVHRFEVNNERRRSTSRDGCPLVFSPDGKLLASGLHGDSVYVWDVTTGQQACRLKEFNEDEFLHTTTFSPDGKLLCTADGKAGVRLWQVPAGKLLRQFPRNGRPRFSPNGELLALSAFGSLDVVEVSTGKSLHVMPIACYDFSFAPDSTAMAAVDRFTGRLWVWCLPSGERHKAFGGDRRVAEELAVAGDGKSVLAWDSLGHFQWHDLVGGQALNRFDLPPWEKVRVAADTKFMATQQSNIVGGEPIILRDPATGKETGRFTPQPANVSTEFAVSADGRLVAAGSWRRHDGEHFEIALYETGKGQITRTLEKLPLGERRYWWGFHDLAVAPDGRTLAVIGLRSIMDGESHSGVYVWDLQSGKQHPPFGGKHSADALAYTADSKGLLLTRRGRPTCLVSVASGEERCTLEDSADLSRPFAFSPDGRLVAAVRQSQGLREAPIRLWDVATGQKLHVFNGHPDRVLSLAFTSDGKRLISGSADTTMLVWDLGDVPNAQVAPKRHALRELALPVLVALVLLLTCRFGLWCRRRT